MLESTKECVGSCPILELSVSLSDRCVRSLSGKSDCVASGKEESRGDNAREGGDNVSDDTVCSES